MSEFEMALHTRPSERYGFDWSRVELTRNSVTLPKTKNEKAHHIRLNTVAVGAFKVLQKRSLSGKGEVFVSMKGEPLRRYKHRFEPVVEEAGSKLFGMCSGETKRHQRWHQSEALQREELAVCCLR